MKRRRFWYAMALQSLYHLHWLMAGFLATTGYSVGLWFGFWSKA